MGYVAEWWSVRNNFDQQIVRNNNEYFFFKENIFADQTNLTLRYVILKGSILGKFKQQVVRKHRINYLKKKIIFGFMNGSLITTRDKNNN